MTKIKLCAFADESGSALETQIENMTANGVYAVELRSVDGINVGDLSDEFAEKIYSAFSAAGISVWSLGSPLGKIDVGKPFCEHEKLLRRLIEIAHIMHTDNIRMFSYFVKREDYAKYEAEVLERLNRLVAIAAAEGINLCHENESAIFGATVDNCKKILSGVPGIKLVYDPANYIMWDENIPYALEKLYGDTYYFHIKDVIATSKQIVPSGYGDGMIEEMVRRLDRDATFTIEPHLHIFDGYGKIDRKELKNAFTYANQRESFAAAVGAFKNILTNCGYREEEKGIWIK